MMAVIAMTSGSLHSRHREISVPASSVRTVRPGAIKVEGLGKQYRLGRAQKASYGTLRDVLAAAPSRLGQNIMQRVRRRSATSQSEDSIWALRDVSFDVQPGEIVGIIGPNGAGKSTLLKILCRVVEPTMGQVHMAGRVAALLEVGTGFHTELTGRENVYLSGAILGMSRSEIRRKFDEIVAFAEVEKFLDTPVKYYSSGMYLRLAFAVAAHLEPEILIVDEVLAVGDTRFQRKCFAKMEDVGHEGRSILLVSHNMSDIARLCQRAIRLDAGAVASDGPAAQVVSGYLNTGLGVAPERVWGDEPQSPGGDGTRLHAVRVRGEDNGVADYLDIRRSIIAEMEYSTTVPNLVLTPYFQFRNADGIWLFSTADMDPEWRGRPRPVGRYVSQVTIPGNFLAEGVVLVTAGCERITGAREFRARDAVGFHVIDSAEGDSARGDNPGHVTGVVRPLLPWATRSLDVRPEVIAQDGR